MIVGADGVIVIDTQVDPPAAEGVLTAFRNITDKPVKAIVLTHGHGDHTGGIGVFAAAGGPEVWARQGYGEERRWLEEAGLHVYRARGVRQAGFMLTPEERLNNGVAQAYWPKRGGAAFDAQGRPTHFFAERRKTLEVAGVRLELGRRRR